MREPSVTRVSAPGNLAWLDLEMTGLDPIENVILQAALIVTNAELQPLEELVLDIWQPEEALAKMVPFVADMHEKTGLTKRVRKSKVDLVAAERQLMERQEPSRRALGREKFLEKVWAWKAESGGTITNQLKRLGGLAHRGVRAAAPAGPEPQLFARRPRRFQPVGMALQVDARAARVGRVQRAEPDLARLQPHQARHGPQQAGLARPVRPGQRARLPGRQVQRHRLEKQPPAPPDSRVLDRQHRDQAMAPIETAESAEMR